MPVFNKMVYNGTEYILGGGGNIGEPLNLTVTTSGLDATITWEDNEIGTIPPTTFQKSELVRKIGSAPTSPSDGDLVVTETVKDTYKVSGYVDQGLTDGETYYYRVFSYSDLGGISYCDSVSVTPSEGWHPGANTICYYPLTSVSQGSDMKGSGTAYDLTASGTVTYQDVGGVDCCLMNGQLSTSISTVTSAGGITISYWYKYYGAPGSDNGQMVALNNGTPNAGWVGGILCNGRPYSAGNIAVIARGAFPYGAYDNTKWVHICITENTTTVSLYIDGVLVGTQTPDNSTYGGLNIGYTSRTLNGYLSEVIYESVEWTASEISDYYDAKKGDYGIS